jgi:hypothetical protein
MVMHLFNFILYYRCRKGWHGELCNMCMKMEGCSEPGSCRDEAYTCQCEAGWGGRLCDCPICRNGNQSEKQLRIF